jgi:hypothetical protein
MHDIKHQITYKGSNFIFHDSQGFESGARDELEAAWDFIEKRSVAANLTDQLHAIWYHSLFNSFKKQFTLCKVLYTNGQCSSHSVFRA